MKFNEYNVIVRDEYLDAYKSFVLKDSLDMLHYYGIGGIGKTTLKKD
ncbi:hypothetical protein [Rummeliibacillus pycnus]|nr:hypothetical protein [Rummeliibacillus pycnus]